MERNEDGTFNSKSTLGEKNINWKGDNVGYHAIHDWMYRHYGAPAKCEHCGSTKKSRYEWANLSGTYKRVRSDWARLCVACHIKYDDRDRGLRAHQQAPVREMNSRNKSGYKNVYQDKRNGRYVPYITVAKRKQKTLGSYPTAEEAYAVYKQKALELYGTY